MTFFNCGAVVHAMTKCGSVHYMDVYMPTLPRFDELERGKMIYVQLRRRELQNAVCTVRVRQAVLAAEREFGPNLQSEIIHPSTQ